MRWNPAIATDFKFAAVLRDWSFVSDPQAAGEKS